MSADVGSGPLGLTRRDHEQLWIDAHAKNARRTGSGASLDHYPTRSAQELMDSVPGFAPLERTLRLLNGPPAFINRQEIATRPQKIVRLKFLRRGVTPICTNHLRIVDQDKSTVRFRLDGPYATTHNGDVIMRNVGAASQKINNTHPRALRTASPVAQRVMTRKPIPISCSRPQHCAEARRVRCAVNSYLG